ncbi:MAG TPA: DNA polymerase I [Thermomicrobiaceae bacterium]|nr:DNA polymerase I [Thermomicrobiaceae bacterium]
MTTHEDDAGRTIMLVDGHGLAYRAFHAVPETLATAGGEATNAVFGFTSMLLDALRQHHPDFVVVSFDVGRTFRHDAFEEYKAHRAPMPEDLRHQMQRIHQVLTALNIPVFTKEGYEADDVIGTLSRLAVGLGMRVLIVTGDSDLLQLADPGVEIVLPGRQRFGDYRVYDRAAVHERYGFDPERIPDYKALVGDTSDNIPGVPGIGAKGATGLIQQFPSLEAMHDHLDQVSPTRARNALTEHFDEALQGRELATIVRGLDLELDLERCVLGDFDRDGVVAVFRELEFRTLVSRLPDQTRPQRRPVGGPAKGSRTIIRLDDQLAGLVQELIDAPAIALDVETTAVDPMRADLVGIALATSPERSYYVPLSHVGDDGQLDADEVRGALSPILADPNTVIYTHHGKYDAIVMERAGYPRPHIGFDTMIAAYLLGETSIDLKSLAFTRLGMEMTEITELIGRGRNQITMDLTEIARAGDYASADVEATYRLVEVLRPDVEAQQQTSLLHDIELPLVDVLIDMEEAGIAIDGELLRSLGRQLAGQIGELEGEIYRLAKHEFNINSTRQLGTVLFDEQGLPTGRRTKTGYSVSQEVLEGLRFEAPIVDSILEYRQLLKLKSTYVDTLPEQINPRTGRVHTSFNQTIAATGRLSSIDPNLQNIPVRTDIGRSVRRAFIADNRPGYQPFDEEAVFLSADYSQIELRLMAHLSGDETLTSAFQEGKDIHAATAADVFGVDLPDVTSDMRRVAKTVNFGIMYGMQAYGLSRDTGMSRQDAQRFIERYMARLPGVGQFLQETKRQAAAQGYVSSMFGRRRYVPDIDSSNGMRRQAAERMAINMPLQGSAADIMKIAMIRVHEEIRRHRLRSRMLLQVHDELLFEVPRSELHPMADLAMQVMEHVVALSVPLVVEVAAGANWDQLEPL